MEWKLAFRAKAYKPFLNYVYQTVRNWSLFISFDGSPHCFRCCVFSFTTVLGKFHFWKLFVSLICRWCLLKYIYIIFSFLILCTNLCLGGRSALDLTSVSVGHSYRPNFASVLLSNSISKLDYLSSITWCWFCGIFFIVSFQTYDYQLLIKPSC